MFEKVCTGIVTAFGIAGLCVWAYLLCDLTMALTKFVKGWTPPLKVGLTDKVISVPSAVKEVVNGRPN